MHYILCFGKDDEEGGFFLLLFLLQDQCSSFSDKGNPMVMNAIGFLLIVFFLAALSYNLLRMDSHGLQTTLSIC